jgi:hypothetical protein
MPKPIEIPNFVGMNDVKTAEGFFTEKDAAEPSAILNADVDIRGRLVRRPGKTRLVLLPHAHSLWAGNSCMLCCADGVLYDIQGVIATSVGTTGIDAPLSYEEIDDLIYISSKYWNGIYSHVTKAIASWGVALPPSPVLLPAVGSLPAGYYRVCMTNVVGSELSGNGLISTIELTSVGGIQILNRPAGAIVWCTDQNEGIFYRVGAVDVIADIPSVEPLPSFMCSPPPYMDNLCYAFGLLWGSVDNIVFYCQPYKYSWYKPTTNRFKFDSEVSIIARVPTGLFIGCLEKTSFLAGTEPAKMQQSYAGTGSIPGTLVYCHNLPELGDILGTSEKGYVSVPVWRTLDGIVAGNAGGRLFNLSKDKLRLDTVERGASLYTNVDGTFKFLTSAKRGHGGSAVGVLNAVTAALFASGKISQSEFAHRGMGSTQSIRDTAICDLNKYFARTEESSMSFEDEVTCELL